MRYVIDPNDIEPIQLVGREMRRLITSNTVGAKALSVGVISVPPGEAVLPCHSHNAEEALYIVKGEGQYWIEGEIGAFKAREILWYPPNSRHMIKNTGEQELVGVFIFSPPTHPDDYVLYEDIRFDQ